MQIPPIVAAATDRAREAGFTASSERSVGRFLAVLAGAVPPGGRILEIGTGTGVGLAWLVHGLGGRTDVEVHSVELDPPTHALTAGAGWPPFVRTHAGDVLSLYDTLGTFDLIFADAPGGKWNGLDRTIAALGPAGVLLVDDMTPAEWGSAEHEQHTREVRETLLSHDRLNAVEIAWSSGLILCSRRAATR
jgi:predicted O-methyltransferase YrrM